MSEIHILLGKINSELKPVAKSQEHPKYKFRGIDDFYKVIHPLLQKYGVLTIPEMKSYEHKAIEGKEGKNIIYAIVTMSYHFTAGDGSEVCAIVVGEGMDWGDKAINKALSAAQKYALIQIFCWPTEEMIDSETEEMIDSEKDSPEIQKSKDTSIEMTDYLSSLPCDINIMGTTHLRGERHSDIPRNFLYALPRIYREEKLKIQMIPSLREKLALNAEDAMKLRNETAEEKEEKDFEKKCKEMSFTELETTSKRTKNPSKKAIALMYFMKAILVRPELDSSLAKEYYSFLSNLPPTDFSSENADLFKETTSFLIQKGGIL